MEFFNQKILASKYSTATVPLPMKRNQNVLQNERYILYNALIDMRRDDAFLRPPGSDKPTQKQKFDSTPGPAVGLHKHCNEKPHR